MKVVAAAAASLGIALTPFAQAQTPSTNPRPEADPFALRLAQNERSRTLEGSAQPYPAKTVSLVVPFPAGGGTDIVARLAAQKLTESLKGNVVVENRPGASTQIGTRYVVDAAPDGHTLLIGTTSLVNGPALFGNKLPYDHNKQLRPVISLADLPIFLSVNAQK